MNLGRRLFWVLAAGLMVFVLGTLGRLPPVVASHFDGAGTPNGWSSRTGYLTLLMIVGLVLPLGIVAGVHASILAAHTHDPPHLDRAGIVVLIGGAVAALGAWTAGWYRLLRPAVSHG